MQLSERVTGIEPAFSAWEADVLPLNYTRQNGRLGVARKRTNARGRRNGCVTKVSAL